MSSGGKELLDVLSDVKTRVQDKLGIVDFPMPQFILIGKQSVGKSRLIESLAGEQFNFVSGTLGSRRPTVLEFRNVAQHPSSQWFVLDKAKNVWGKHPLQEVMKIIGNAHEELGASVSDEAVYVRVESPQCVDMQIVDLPGFREFAMDPGKKALADQIAALNERFMQDKRNVMLCVEEAGDAANLATLSRCKQIDPNFERTILIRNKLDKYYRDLTDDNINNWLDGFGDLPKSLQRFAVTLPHWANENEAPPQPFPQMREEANNMDQTEIKNRGAKPEYLQTIGFNSFAGFMERKIEELFVKAIGPVMEKLRALKTEHSSRMENLKDEVEKTNPANILSTVRDCGMSFAGGLNHVMEGFVRSDLGRLTLEEELKAFHQYHQALGSDHFVLLPSEDFDSLDAYVDYLRSDIKAPNCDVDINGGAQFRRLLFEVEVFLRFSEIASDIKKRDVIQARGVSMMTLTWRDVVVKLLSNEAHLPLIRRVNYIGERLKWFFCQQKEAILDFMSKLKGSQDEHMFSGLLSKHVQLINDNEMIKHLIFTTYDDAVDRQLTFFKDLFSNMLASTFANPWLFLKRASVDGDMEDGGAKEDIGGQIPEEINSRAGLESTLSKWINDIPSEPTEIADAVDRVQMLVVKTYSYIRSQVCDQVELFAESFFKTPMMRRLEEDMSVIDLSESDKETYAARRKFLEGEHSTCSTALTEVDECIQKLQAFSLKSQARSR